MSLPPKLTLDKYLEAEQSFYDCIRAKLKDNLLLYCLTGSLSRHDIIEGWSDIDILLVIESHSEANLRAVNEALEANQSEIKIGVTFYSVKEFNGHHYKDTKTLVAIRLIKQNLLKPRIMSPTIVIPEITATMSRNYDLAEFSKILHDLKRGLLDYSPANERSVYKAIVTLIKILLRRQGISYSGYANVMETAQRELENFPCTFALPPEIVNHPEMTDERYHNYVKFLNWLKESKYAEIAKLKPSNNRRV